ncbi:arabinogalactan protein 1-like [Capsicum annuum]|uniref:arabinogalactan protein 1-like n=1 Tax=Capsicum annuum TaxID=4072 RepID=UPI001FB19189|nr:arabinogalactan protein 1-like [Capsicum annuum]
MLSRNKILMHQDPFGMLSLTRLSLSLDSLSRSTAFGAVADRRRRPDPTTGPRRRPPSPVSGFFAGLRRRRWSLAPSPSSTYGADPTAGHHRTLSLPRLGPPAPSPSPTYGADPTAGPDCRSPTAVAEIRFPPAVPPLLCPDPPSAGTVQQGSSCSSVFSRQPRIHLSSDPPVAGRRGAWLPAWSTSEIW